MDWKSDETRWPKIFVLSPLEIRTLAALVKHGNNKAAARALNTNDRAISSRRRHIAAAFGGNFLAAVAAWGADTGLPEAEAGAPIAKPR